MNLFFLFFKCSYENSGYQRVKFKHTHARTHTQQHRMHPTQNLRKGLCFYTPVSFLFSEPPSFWSNLDFESVWSLSSGPETGGQFSSFTPSQTSEQRRPGGMDLASGAPCCWAIAVRRQFSHCCLW